MRLAIQLLGRPTIIQGSGDTYQFRSRKSWALLAYLILSERPPTRSQLASLLFSEADDPIRALRWSLTEIRRGLGPDTTIDGDPVIVQLPTGTLIDIAVLRKGAWAEAIGLPGLGSELLDGTAVRGAAAFHTWLLAEQRQIAAASEAILHEAALGLMSRGETDTAVNYAARAAAMSPLDENHQALLIRLYRLTGDNDAAKRQYEACKHTFNTELGVAPGPAIEAAMRQTRPPRSESADDTTIEAMVEAGTAAISAGALDSGVSSLRTAARLADGSGSTHLRVTSRFLLAEALIHSLGGLDEEGLATLYEADEIALSNDLTDAVAQARSELGYVDFLRARYDRAELWLTDALKFADGSPAITAKATTYLGCVESDRGNYQRATTLLSEAVKLSRAAGDLRREAFGLSMLGRINLLCDDLQLAAEQLDASIEVAVRDRWLAFLPWPQALRGEVQLARADTKGASELLQQAFARACQLGDPCWEGLSARALALLAEATGDTARAFEILSDARTRCNRLADPYVWLDGYILDAQCELGRRHGHTETGHWIETLKELAARTGMKELMLRALLHGAALGSDGDSSAARILAGELEDRIATRLLGIQAG